MRFLDYFFLELLLSLSLNCFFYIFHFEAQFVILEVQLCALGQDFLGLQTIHLPFIGSCLCFPLHHEQLKLQITDPSKLLSRNGVDLWRLRSNWPGYHGKACSSCVVGRRGLHRPLQAAWTDP